jgi:hypothetical protein
LEVFDSFLFAVNFAKDEFYLANPYLRPIFSYLPLKRSNFPYSVQSCAISLFFGYIFKGVFNKIFLINRPKMRVKRRLDNFSSRPDKLSTGVNTILKGCGLKRVFNFWIQDF